MAKITLHRAYQLFIRDRVIKGCVDETVRQYEYVLKPLAEMNPEVSIAEAKDTIVSRIESVMRSEYSRNTKVHHVKAMRAFVRFCVEEKFIQEPIVLPSLSWPKSHVRPLTLAQMRWILRSFDTDTFLGLRDKTIVQLFFDCGIRRVELSRLEIPDVDLKQRYIFVRGKGRKNVWIPVTATMTKQLWSYMKQRERRATDNLGLFVTRTGTHMSVNSIKMIFKKLKKEFDFPGIRFSPHTLRHSFALNYIESGGDPFSLQAILRHESQEMTSRYVRMAKSNTKTAHDRYSPGNFV